MLKKLIFGALFSALSMTSLETAIANNVSVRVVRNNVVVTGDANANSLIVTQPSATSVLIRGTLGTQVNGKDRLVVNGIKLNELVIRMDAGNDRVVLSGLEANEVLVDLGAGTDRLLSNNSPCVISRELEVFGRAGTDIVRLSNWEIGECSIHGNSGALNLRINGMVANHLEVKGDRSRDIVRLLDSTIAGEIDFQTAGGSDVVFIDGVTSKFTEILAGGGNDRVDVIDSTIFLDLEVNVGGGSDAIDLESSEVGRELEVTAGVGNDDLVVMDVVVDLNAELIGGSGRDSLENTGLIVGGELEVVGFENR